ncbi:MAG: glycosyltransferase family 2 protein [Candidatus Aenigmarchaeota archaeon]|nr:glycosyltransferase family 2 protein [Candidatus Aenigmarchaeota archaeon]
MKVSVVIPAKNESKNLPELLSRIRLVARRCKEIDEIIVADNNSTDRTPYIARKFGCRVVCEKRPGKGSALRAGFSAAKNDYIVMLDADLSHIPEDIPKMIALLKDPKVGLVQASRSLGGSEEYSFVRAIGNISLTAFANFMLGARMTDALNGFKAMRKEMTAGLSCSAFDIEIEILTNCLRLGYKVTEVPSQEKARANGTSNLGALKDGWRFARQIMKDSVRMKL